MFTEIDQLILKMPLKDKSKKCQNNLERVKNGEWPPRGLEMGISNILTLHDEGCSMDFTQNH